VKLIFGILATIAACAAVAIAITVNFDVEAAPNVIVRIAP